jgi:hypothetical protein
MMNTDTPPSAQTTTKYNIGRRLKELPGVYRENCYLFCVYVGVSTRTLENWVKLPVDTKTCIPSDTLFLVADFFKINPIHLLNK